MSPTYTVTKSASKVAEGGEVTFTITDKGLSVIGCTTNGTEVVSRFSSGPFVPAFETF